MQLGFGQPSITLCDEPALAALDNRRAISTSRDNKYPRAGLFIEEQIYILMIGIGWRDVFNVFSHAVSDRQIRQIRRLCRYGCCRRSRP
jgi:hypothetical protein